MKKWIFSLALFTLIGIFFTAGLKLRPFGHPIISDMGRFLVHQAQQRTSTNNIVTAVVFDYRGFDTLGEATVLFSAIIGISALFRRVHPRHE